MDNNELLLFVAMKTTFELHQQVQETSYVSLYRETKINREAPEVIFAGKERCSKDYSFKRSSFPVYVFEYVLAGRGELYLDDKKYQLSKGSCFIYGPTIPCSIMSSSSEPMEKSFIAFQFDENEFDEPFPLANHFIQSSHEVLGFEDLLEQMFKAAFSGSEYANPISRRYLEILFLKWMEYSKESELVYKNSRSKFLYVKQQIDDNFLEFKRIEDISQAAELTPSYVSRLFKQNFHMTPYNYLLKKKMEYAMDLLSSSDLSVAETAIRTGFDDQFHFSRIFKMVMHKPPSAFKQKKKN